MVELEYEGRVLRLPEREDSGEPEPGRMEELDALYVARRTGRMQPTFTPGQISHCYPDGHVEHFPIPAGMLSPFNPKAPKSRAWW